MLGARGTGSILDSSFVEIVNQGELRFEATLPWEEFFATFALQAFH